LSFISNCMDSFGICHTIIYHHITLQKLDNLC
jgi:hypothetical protein